MKRNAKRATLVGLSAAEAAQIAGGGNLPGIKAIKTEIPTWKYDKYGHTPAWAIAAAVAMGYEIEGV